MNPSATPGEHLFWPVERWQSLQATALQDHLQHACTSPLYSALKLSNFQSITRESLPTLLSQLPITTKNILADAGPSAWAIPPSGIAEWVCTSGTSGKPLDIPLTHRDLDRLAENEAVALSIAGLQRGDLLILAVGMDRMFVAGLAYWLGAQRLGATCIRLGPQIASHAETLSDLSRRVAFTPSQRTFVICVPSFLSNVIPPQFQIAGVIGIGEPTRLADLTHNTCAQRLHSRLNCPILSTYAATETCATFAEGSLCKGGHLNPALAIVEILNDNATPLPPGQVGEVVVTPLGVEGLPLLRFRTGDMAALYTEACPCGRTTPRLGPILCRRQQLLKIRGTSVFPAAIIEALNSSPSVIDCAIVAEQDDPLSDRVTLYVQLQEQSPALLAAIENRLRGMLRVIPKIEIVSESQLRELQFPEGSRKSRRFIDRRPPFKP